MVARFRLLPCVKELLRNSRDTPHTTRDGNLMPEGMTPAGDQFKVIIRPEKKGCCLQTLQNSRTGYLEKEKPPNLSSQAGGTSK
jgi:hypothetical protein